MANPSISIDDEDLEKFDKILQVKAMLGELDSDRRSPVIKKWIKEYIEENQEDLERYEAFVEGNGAPTAVVAD